MSHEPESDDARVRARTGVHAVAAGILLQILGLGWDLWMHRQDPHLAEVEGPLTIANPSHALIALGLGVAISGTIYQLLLSTRRVVDRSFVIGFVALAFVAGTAVIGIAGETSGHDHGGSPVTATQDHDHDADPAHDHEASALVTALEQTIEQDGLPTALRELGAAADADAEVASSAHHIVHMLGRYAYDVYPSLAEAFGSCTSEFESGCYHGVLEGALASHSDVMSADVDEVCTTAAPSTGTANLRFQCLHGLGHGVMGLVDEDVSEALGFCDGLSVEWERGSCHGGVFMENIVRAQSAARAGEPTELVRFDNPLYPCDSVGSVYMAACYQMQSSIILWFNGFDFAAASKTCLSAPRRFVTICHEGIGREVFGTAIRNGSSTSAQEHREALELCAEVATGFRSECLIAVARSLLNVDGTTDEAIAFCSSVPRAEARRCFTTVGESIAGHLADPSARVQACSAVGRRYAGSCRRGAQVLQTST